MFIQMAYNLINMFWVGKLGSGAIASVGSAGFFTWLGMSVVFLPKIGLEVTVAQSAGKDDTDALRHYMTNGLILTGILAFVYAMVIRWQATGLIGFFQLGNDLHGYDPTAGAIFLSGMIGLEGIWWSISGSSILKGVVLVAWFTIFYRWYLRKKRATENVTV
jgi:Na+-driven multidrug efflux pump